MMRMRGCLRSCRGRGTPGAVVCYAQAMSDSTELVDAAPEETVEEPRPKAPPIDSRFLYVDVAAMRAKQLRRGARPRLDDDDNPGDAHRIHPIKPERVAMEEVRRGLVLYEVPPAKPVPPAE